MFVRAVRRSEWKMKPMYFFLPFPILSNLPSPARTQAEFHVLRKLPNGLSPPKTYSACGRQTTRTPAANICYSLAIHGLFVKPNKSLKRVAERIVTDQHSRFAGGFQLVAESSP